MRCTFCCQRWLFDCLPLLCGVAINKKSLSLLQKIESLNRGVILSIILMNLFSFLLSEGIEIISSSIGVVLGLFFFLFAYSNSRMIYVSREIGRIRQEQGDSGSTEQEISAVCKACELLEKPRRKCWINHLTIISIVFLIEMLVVTIIGYIH